MIPCWSAESILVDGIIILPPFAGATEIIIDLLLLPIAIVIASTPADVGQTHNNGLL